MIQLDCNSNIKCIAHLSLDKQKFFVLYLNLLVVFFFIVKANAKRVNIYIYNVLLSVKELQLITQASIQAVYIEFLD